MHRDNFTFLLFYFLLTKKLCKITRLQWLYYGVNVLRNCKTVNCEALCLQNQNVSNYLQSNSKFHCYQYWSLLSGLFPSQFLLLHIFTSYLPKWYLRFSWWWLWRLPSSVMLHCVGWKIFPIAVVAYCLAYSSTMIVKKTHALEALGHIY
jgi:hypothetical protein